MLGGMPELTFFAEIFAVPVLDAVPVVVARFVSGSGQILTIGVASSAGITICHSRTG
jgi:hypothetical protein